MVSVISGRIVPGCHEKSHANIGSFYRIICLYNRCPIHNQCAFYNNEIRLVGGFNGL